MAKTKKWQSLLIIVVIALTLYNILPTIFYYARPLKKPITEKQAKRIGETALTRVNSLEKACTDWISSYLKLVNLKASNIKLDKKNPQFVHVTFPEEKQAQMFKSLLHRAGTLIPFYPAQLTSIKNELNPKTVIVQRKIPLHFAKSQHSDYFSFVKKFDDKGLISKEYETIIKDRMAHIIANCTGVSENARLLKAITTNPSHTDEELLMALVQNILNYADLNEAAPNIANRFFSTFTQDHFSNKGSSIDQLLGILSNVKDQTKLAKINLENKESELQKDGKYLDSKEQQELDYLTSKEYKLSKASQIITKNKRYFSSGKDPLLEQEVFEAIDFVSPFIVGQYNPIIKSAYIDWDSETLHLTLHSDIHRIKQSNDAYISDKLQQLTFNEIAKISREADEKIKPNAQNFSISLAELENSQSMLVMNLNTLAKAQSEHLTTLLKQGWSPEYKDLQQDQYPIELFSEFSSKPKNEQYLSLVIYAPILHTDQKEPGFQKGSMYVIAKDLNRIAKKFESIPNSSQAQQFFNDFNKLKTMLEENGFIAYPGSIYPFASQFANDIIFECSGYYNCILKATRENFIVKGSKKYACLEFSNLKHRIATVNNIESQMQEELLKWRDEYHANLINPSKQAKFEMPKPTKSPLLNNVLLNVKKYFRGDDRKVIHWGLDLMGGKTVQIALKDQNNKLVTNPDDLNQGINELYRRVNKMGVSEVSIRQEGDCITLDFPGSQELCASELIKASSMSFHIVNEKFSLANPKLAETTNRFLEQVWNEAVVTNKKDIDSINEIARRHLYGDGLDPEHASPRSEFAKTLYDNGLRISDPKDSNVSSAFNDRESKIAIYRGDTPSEWYGQSFPLLIVFKNYALEGSSLDNVRANYDPNKGNYLSFDVKSSQTYRSGEKLHPRSELYNWSSTFAKDKVYGTEYEKYSQGRGWRMAVILNGQVVSSPTLDAALKDSAMISGSFTQREVNKLESDLKAGSLTFTPQILSEKNISPDLGLKERSQAILAIIVALILVVAVMVGYYRFAGLIACVAVFFNLLIIWATLQNIQATLSLAGIAGVILTVGMAVDANVLVFERIKEEFSLTNNISNALKAGYQKAFSAILDSNITTIIAAVILLNFDSGPIKGLALTLIIGIASSMFTALFMTKFFFARWVQNPANTKLNMMNLIKSTNFNFLRYWKITAVIAIIITCAGSTLFIKQKDTILGMDFTGGYALNFEVKPNDSNSYRYEIEKALVKAGADKQNFQVRELSPKNHIRIFFGRGMQEMGMPFHNMPLEKPIQDAAYAYQNNPRIAWLVCALNESDIHLAQNSLESLDKNWTSISGQISDAMRKNALLGLALALVCILLYITFRFEFNYAISATLGLAFDVTIVLSLLSILHFLKVPLQIDLNTIAALMTIVGYSLNDTIIVFDRIREDVTSLRKHSFAEVITHALNVTLSRTIMTSFTTFVVLLALVVLGGSTTFGFSFIMALGVVVGTLSTLFVSCALLLFFHQRDKKVSKQATNIP